MSEFGGSWKHQINPACTESSRVFIMLSWTLYKRRLQQQITPHNEKSRRRTEINEQHHTLVAKAVMLWLLITTVGGGGGGGGVLRALLYTINPMSLALVSSLLV